MIAFQVVTFGLIFFLTSESLALPSPRVEEEASAMFRESLARGLQEAFVDGFVEPPQRTKRDTYPWRRQSPLGQSEIQDAIQSQYDQRIKRELIRMVADVPKSIAPDVNRKLVKREISQIEAFGETKEEAVGRLFSQAQKRFGSNVQLNFH